MGETLDSFDHRLSRLLGSPITAGVFLTVMAAVYVLFPTRYFNYADDSLRWAYEISIESGIINTHHLYLNILRPVYQWLSGAAGVDAVAFLSVYSGLFGVVGLLYLYLLLGRIVDRSIALLGTAFCATTAGYWSYAIVSDAYVPMAALMLGGLYHYFAALEHGRGRPALLDAGAAVLCLVGMILHHQALALVVIGLFFGSLAATQYPLRRRLRHGIVVPALTGLATIAVYLGVYAVDVERNEDQSAAEYMAGYADTFVAYPDMKSISASTLAKTPIGIGTSLLSANFAFGTDAVTSRVQDVFPHRHVHAYPYLVRGLGTPAYAVIAASTAAGVLLLLVLIPAGAWAGLRDRSLARPILVASVPQIVFFVWWESVSDEFWIWLIPIVAIAVSLAIDRLRYSRAAYLLLLVPVALSTYLGAVGLYQSEDNDIDSVNDAFVAELGEGDLLVAMDEIVALNRNRLAMLEQGFQYFNIFTRASKGLPVDIAELETMLDETARRGGTVYVSPYVSTLPKSYVALIETNNPDFAHEYRTILTLLERHDPTHVEPRIAPPAYFTNLPKTLTPPH